MIIYYELLQIWYHPITVLQLSVDKIKVFKIRLNNYYCIVYNIVKNYFKTSKVDSNYYTHFLSSRRLSIY